MNHASIHISDYNKLIDEFKCQNYSPHFSFKYGLPTIHHVKGAAFCSEYSKRTCCNHTNFETIRSKWIRMNSYAEELSENCFSTFRQLICYDCDSDIGLGLKDGLCSRTCNMLYAACIDDYFIFNEMNLLGFCERNSVICSKARDIAGTPADFCKALGFTQNENENFEDLLEAIISNSTIKPVCFNMKPSSSLFGPASKIKDFEKFIILQIEISLLTMLSLIILFNFF